MAERELRILTLKNEMTLRRSRWGMQGLDVRKSAEVRRNGRKLPDTEDKSVGKFRNAK